MTVHPAPLQLADLAAEMRPDWDRAAFQQALDTCRFAHSDDDGWDFARTLRLAAVHLADPSASPRDLAAAARPFGRHAGAKPSAAYREIVAEALSRLPGQRTEP